MLELDMQCGHFNLRINALSFIKSIPAGHEHRGIAKGNSINPWVNAWSLDSNLYRLSLCLYSRTEEEEYNENLHKVSTLLRGECGLLFTNEKTDDVLEWFEGLAHPDYAR